MTDPDTQDLDAAGLEPEHAIDPPQPPDWLVRAERAAVAHLPPDHPERIARMRALYGAPIPRKS